MRPQQEQTALLCQLHKSAFKEKNSYPSTRVAATANFQRAAKMAFSQTEVVFIW